MKEKLLGYLAETLCPSRLDDDYKCPYADDDTSELEYDCRAHWEEVLGWQHSITGCPSCSVAESIVTINVDKEIIAQVINDLLTKEKVNVTINP